MATARAAGAQNQNVYTRSPYERLVTETRHYGPGEEIVRAGWVCGISPILQAVRATLLGRARVRKMLSRSSTSPGTLIRVIWRRAEAVMIWRDANPSSRTRHLLVVRLAES